MHQHEWLVRGINTDRVFEQFQAYQVATVGIYLCPDQVGGNGNDGSALTLLFHRLRCWRSGFFGFRGGDFRGIGHALGKINLGGFTGLGGFGLPGATIIRGLELHPGSPDHDQGQTQGNVQHDALKIRT